MRSNQHEGFRRGRGRGHAHGHGRHGEWGSHMPGSMGGWRGGRGRMRRGDIRTAILAVLAESPGHGYDIITRLQEKSGGMWRPSAGSVYPTLQQLEDEGLVETGEGEGRQPFTLTDAGRTYVSENREQLGEPWAKLAEGVGEERLELRGLMGQVGAAVFQVAAAGDEQQVAKAKELLSETRRALYRILAEDDPA